MCFPFSFGIKNEKSSMYVHISIFLFGDFERIQKPFHKQKNERAYLLVKSLFIMFNIFTVWIFKTHTYVGLLFSVSGSHYIIIYVCIQIWILICLTMNSMLSTKRKRTLISSIDFSKRCTKDELYIGVTETDKTKNYRWILRNQVRIVE